MFKLTKLIQLRPEISAAERAQFAEKLRAAVGAIPQVKRSMLQPTLPGVYNGGDFIWHLQFADEAAYRAAMTQSAWTGTVAPLLAGPQVQLVESAAYNGGRGRTSKPLSRGVYRTLLLRIEKPVAEDVIARFETETAAMPDYIKTIMNWQLSRVSEGSGSRQWTHVWEQEYAELGGLHGAYMMHPYHWGHIDRWFDPEGTDWMIDTFLCHTFCDFEGAVI